MNYIKIKKIDIANGQGISTTIYFAGCNQHCKGCFNSEYWDFKKGRPFTDQVKEELFGYLSNPNVRNLSILGGEPLQQGEELTALLSEVKEKFPDKKIWLWTGYYLKELNEAQLKTISYCDYIIDGRFEEDKSGINLVFKGSSNQTVWQRDSNGELTEISDEDLLQIK